jgi:hypothetical protein
MAGPFVYDRIQESTTTTGTGPLILGGAEAGGFFQFSSVLTDGQQAPYAIQDTMHNDAEVGIGTYQAAGNQWLRTQVLRSTNGNALVNFQAGTKDVFIDVPMLYLAPIVASQAANTFFAGPVSGGALQAAFRTIVNSDIPITLTLTAPTDSTVVGVTQGHSSSHGVDLWRWQVTAGNTRARITYKGEFSNPTPADGTGTSNEVFGALAGSNLTTGNNNSCFGQTAGQNLTTGGNNNALGMGALQFETTGSSNTAIGQYALRNANGSNNNVGFGVQALLSLTVGTGNMGIGLNSLAGLTTGNNNVGIGIGAGGSCTGGCGDNVAIGFSALQAGSSGNINANIALGTQSLGSGTITTASNNVGIGIRTLNSISSGQNNVAIGHQAGRGSSTGGTALTSGASNTLIGYQADVAAAMQQYGTALGYQAVAQANEFALSPQTNFQTFYTYDSTSVLVQRADLTISNIDNNHATRRYMLIVDAWDTLQRETARFWADGSNGRAALIAPPSAPTDAQIANSEVSWYLDEAGNNLKFRVKYSNGTLKTGTLALA